MSVNIRLRSLLLKLVLIGGVMQIIMLGVVQWYGVRLYERTLATAISIEIATITPLLNAALSQRVFQRDYASARAVLDSLVEAGGNLQYLEVYDAATRLFASVGAVPAAEPIAFAGQQDQVFDARDTLWLGLENVGEVRFGLAPARFIALHHELLYQSIGASALMVVLTIILLSTLAYRLSRRLGDLLRCAQTIGAGDYSVRSMLSGHDELARLGEEFNRMAAALQSRTRALQTSEQRFRAIAEATPYAMAIADRRDGRILYANAAVNELFAIADDPCRHNIVEFWRNADERRQLSDRIAAEGKVLNCELHLQRSGGEPFWAVCSGVTLNWQKQTAFLAGFIDISGRKRMENELRISEQFNRAILDSLPANIVVLDAQGIIIATNRKWGEFALNNNISDPSRADRGVDYLQICELAAAAADADAVRCVSGLRAVLAGSRDSFEMEYPCHGPDNKRWFWMRAIPLHTGTGGLVIVHTDITERWLAAEQQKLMAQAFASTAEGIMIIDAGRQIQWINRAFTTITGYSLDEISDKTPRSLHAEQHDDAFHEQMWQILVASDYWQGEIRNRHKNGSVYPQWLRISAVRDDNGVVTHYVGVFTDITKLKEHEARLAFLAYHDALTGLANRTQFEQQLTEAIDRAERYRHTVGLLFIDLDGFKTVNDSLGHALGDRLLQAVAGRLQTRMRKSDALARFGGDEFIVLLNELGTAQAAAVAAQKILDTLVSPFLIDSHVFYVTASVGIACYPIDGKDANTLLKNADIAMYRAKEMHGNYVMFYSAEMGSRASERLTMINALRLALERGEFVLHYQPRLNLTTGLITGCEALIRWQHPERGLLAPGLFIPLAEETGSIVEIGDWVLKTACAQVKQWHAAGFDWLCVAVNLSASQLRQSKRLVQQLAAILAQTGVDAAAIELEITETAAMHDPEETRRLLNQLNAMGFDIAIDDFGTGYSSMSYLKRFPIDYLKIDRTFIKDLPDDKEDVAITRAMIALAASMHLQVIAEGVETEAQRRFLEYEHCHEIQGYLISKPLPAAAVGTFFSEHTPGVRRVQ